MGLQLSLYDFPVLPKGKAPQGFLGTLWPLWCIVENSQAVWEHECQVEVGGFPLHLYSAGQGAPENPTEERECLPLFSRNRGGGVVKNEAAVCPPPHVPTLTPSLRGQKAAPKVLAWLA